MSMTPLNDLLQSPADEVEESPDAVSAEPAASTEPEPAATTEATASEPADPGASAQQDGESETEKTRRMHALPKWAHERLRANEEKVAAAQRRAAEMEAHSRALQARAAELEEYFAQSQGYAPQKEQVDPIEALRQESRVEIYRTRVQLGHDRAVEKYGAEFTDHASNWAYDRMQSDPQFSARVLSAPDPVALSIAEFRRAQFDTEAARYGYDIDALVQARMGQVPQPPQYQQPAAGVPGASQPKPKLPSDFTSGGSSAGRVSTQWAGPTPLGDLLNPKRT